MAKRMSLKLASAVLLGSLVCLLAVGERSLQAQAADPILGNWILDRANSTFSGQTPDRRSMTFEKLADGSIRHVTDSSVTAGINEDRYTLKYTFKVDGKDYQADGQMPVNTVAFKRIDANTLERTGKYRGDAIETVTYVISGGGKVLTVTQKGTLNGAEVTSVQVFNRQ